MVACSSTLWSAGTKAKKGIPGVRALCKRDPYPLPQEGYCVSQVTAQSSAHTHKETETLGEVSSNSRHTPPFPARENKGETIPG